jgi:hypothetical protein
MKTGLMQVAVLASAMVLSGAALAGGENCASKKGAHKDMSAAATHDGTHGLVLSQETAKAEASATTEGQAQPAEAKPVATEALKI